jgi:hypothetical protein
VILIWSGVEDLEGDGAVHSDAGMTSFWIAPTLYPLEDGVGKLVAGLPFFRVEQFELHCAPEGLHHGIVVGVADGADRGVDTRIDEVLGEPERGVLAAGVQYRLLVVGFLLG